MTTGGRKIEVVVETLLSEEHREALREIIVTYGISELLHGVAFELMERFNFDPDVRARAAWLNRAGAVHALACILDE